MKCLGLTRQGVPCRNEGPFCRIHRPASVGEALQLIARRLWWEVRRHWLYIALVVIAGAEAILWISWWLGFWGPDELGWLQGVVMAFWGPLLVAALWAWKYQGWRQRLGAWLAARRCLIIATLTLWAWLQSCYWPMRLFDSRLAPLLKQPRVFWPIILWPVAIWLAWGLRAALLWPFGFRRRQAPRPAPNWWPVNKPWPPRWLPSPVLYWDWSASRPYWIVVLAICSWTIAKWHWPGVGAAAGLIYVTFFIYSSLAVGPHGGASIPEGHTVAVEDTPHWSGFFMLLWRWGLFHVYGKPGVRTLKGWRILFLRILRLVLGLGPMIFVIATVIAITAKLRLWRNPYWGFGLGLGSVVYWILFALCGWRRIRYIITVTPERRWGKAILSRPYLTLLGVRTRTLSCDAVALRVCHTVPTGWPRVATVDPGVPFGTEGPGGNIIWPYAQRSNELENAIGAAARV